MPKTYTGLERFRKGGPRFEFNYKFIKFGIIESVTFFGIKYEGNSKVVFVLVEVILSEKNIFEL